MKPVVLPPFTSIAVAAMPRVVRVRQSFGRFFCPKCGLTYSHAGQYLRRHLIDKHHASADTLLSVYVRRGDRP